MPELITMTDEERQEWERQVAAIEAEWPAMEMRMDQQQTAASEDSFSGELRRAIRGMHRRGISLPRLLREAQTDWATLDPFLHGEGVLSSTVIDRLVKVLGLHLHSTAASKSENV